MMKRFLSICLFFIFIANSIFAIAPFYKLGDKNAPISEVASEIQEALKNDNFEIIGIYNIGNQANKMVIVFTNSTIKQLALSYSDRGGLAIAQKIGLIHENGKTRVSLLNPQYMFLAYFQDDFSKKANELNVEIDNIKKVFTLLGYTLKPFGGDLRPDDIKEYQYMMGMPEYSDPVKLNSFNSFDEGVKTIRKNLEAKIGETEKVYELVYSDKKVAVFGVGLWAKETGEAHFLSIIGEEQLAAMPYEIILEDTKATMLHGRYRFALYWPELTMSTFTKIMSTPGEVQDALEALTN